MDLRQKKARLKKDRLNNEAVKILVAVLSIKQKRIT